MTVNLMLLILILRVQYSTCMYYKGNRLAVVLFALIDLVDLLCEQSVLIIADK